MIGQSEERISDLNERKNQIIVVWLYDENKRTLFARI